jgi:hypothetical protein
VDETGNRYKYDLPEMIRGVVIRSLDELGHRVSKEPSKTHDTLVVDIRILHFQPGNAFARWVLGVYAVTQEGTITKLTIRLAMKDSSTNRKIYDSVIHADTFGGLAGGLGDDKRIINDVGKNIAKEIDTALRDAQS